MKRRLWTSALLALALAASACGGDDGEETVAGDTDDTTAGAPVETTAASAAVPEFPAGSTMATLQQEGTITVGTKFDQPLFGLRDPRTGEVEGFDVEIAKLVAQGIFGEDVEDKVTFVEAPSRVRETVITDGTVDMVVATYTINDTRKQTVGFAGPYYVAGQDIMVAADNTDITGVDSLNGKRVCSVQGSTSLTNLRERAPQAVVTEFDVYSKCADALGDGRVDAVTTDNVILVGLIANSNGAYKLVGNPFTEEPYGIGVKKEDTEFRNFINDRLEEIYASGEWADAYERTVGEVDDRTPKPPAVDRY